VNRTLTLIRYAAIEGKEWRHGAAALNKNGKLKSLHAHRGQRARDFQDHERVRSEAGRSHPNFGEENLGVTGLNA
jgi:hypothetical protein